MKAVVDTSSLLSLTRYYLPFDKESHVLRLIQAKIQAEDMIVTDRVLNECGSVSNGDVLKSLPFLKDKTFQSKYKCPYKTDAIVLPNHAQFLKRVDDDFQDKEVRRLKGLTDAQYQARKNDFLAGADMKVIMACMSLMSKSKEEVIIICEESRSLNDNKLFKKIPVICGLLNLQILTLPKALDFHYKLKMKFS